MPISRRLAVSVLLPPDKDSTKRINFCSASARVSEKFMLSGAWVRTFLFGSVVTNIFVSLRRCGYIATVFRF